MTRAPSFARVGPLMWRWLCIWGGFDGVVRIKRG